ncbi:MAG: DUF2059 domain-containing protein [Chthoniobacterales bacterium]|jgi:uncharacterized protein
MKVILCLLAAVLVVQPLTVSAEDAGRRKAAETLLQLMDMQAVLTQSVDQMLDMQIKQNPAIAPYQQEMKDFFAKYMSWQSLKDDIIGIYASEFTEAEMNEMNRFYQTPVGKKALQKTPLLLAKGAELGQKRVQEHLPELQQAIAAKAGKK